MTVSVRIPRVLRGHTDGQAIVQLQAANMAELLDSLYRDFPTLRESLGGGSEDVLKFTNFFINDTEVVERGGMAAELSEGDTVTILPSMAGGAG
jgi:molybdopterin converting factor small subunit